MYLIVQKQTRIPTLLPGVQEPKRQRVFGRSDRRSFTGYNCKDTYNTHSGRGAHLAPFSHDDGRSGVLATRQHHPRRDVGVLQQLEGDEAVVL